MQEFRQCPACGYGRGFHVSFKDAKKGMNIGLVCPSCGRSYDIDWSTKEIKNLSPTEGPKYASMD